MPAILVAPLLRMTRTGAACPANTPASRAPAALHLLVLAARLAPHCAADLEGNTSLTPSASFSSTGCAGPDPSAARWLAGGVDFAFPGHTHLLLLKIETSAARTLGSSEEKSHPLKASREPFLLKAVNVCHCVLTMQCVNALLSVRSIESIPQGEPSRPMSRSNRPGKSVDAQRRENLAHRILRPPSRSRRREILDANTHHLAGVFLLDGSGDPGVSRVFSLASFRCHTRSVVAIRQAWTIKASRAPNRCGRYSSCRTTAYRIRRSSRPRGGCIDYDTTARPRSRTPLTHEGHALPLAVVCTGATIRSHSAPARWWERRQLSIERDGNAKSAAALRASRRSPTSVRAPNGALSRHRCIRLPSGRCHGLVRERCLDRGRAVDRIDTAPSWTRRASNAVSGCTAGIVSTAAMGATCFYRPSLF